MHHFPRHKVVHRDLKPENLLLDSTSKVSLVARRWKTILREWEGSLHWCQSTVGLWPCLKQTCPILAVAVFGTSVRFCNCVCFFFSTLIQGSYWWLWLIQSHERRRVPEHELRKSQLRRSRSCFGKTVCRWGESWRPPVSAQGQLVMSDYVTKTYQLRVPNFVALILGATKSPPSSCSDRK